MYHGGRRCLEICDRGLEAPAILGKNMELERALSLLSDDPPSPVSGRGRGAGGCAEQVLSALEQLQQVSEVLQGEDQSLFIARFLPWALKLMNSTAIKMTASSSEHRIRQGVLTVLKPLTGIAEPMRPFLEDLVQLLLSVLEDDNEENGILAIHLLIDLHKTHRQLMEPYAQPLVDYVHSAFETFSETCEIVFETAKKEERTASGSSRRSSAKETPLLKATSSFKILIECPVMVVLLFQIHRRLVAENIGRFAPQVIKTTAVAIEPPSAASSSQPSSGVEGLAQQSPLMVAYSEYISAQVKMLSFLAYISRGFASIIRPHFSHIPICVIRLLRSCPPDCASARKELLVATRHILSTEIRQAFVPFLGELLDEGLLLGEGYTSYHVLRPLSLSMLADLVHHIRIEIPLGILERIIAVYTKALHDPSLPVGVQTMSAKLLVNLVDVMLVEALGPLSDRKSGLVSIFLALIGKFEWAAGLVTELKGRPDARLYSPFYNDPLASRPIDTDAIGMDPNRDNFRDFRYLLKTLIGGLKNVLFALKALPSSDASAGEEQTGFLSLEEGLDLLDLFRNGIKAFEIFRLADEVQPSGSNTTGSQVPQSPSPLSHSVPDPLLNVIAVQSEEKEIYEQFAYLFTIIEPYQFQEVFSHHLTFLVASMIQNNALLIIPQYFLAIAGVSRSFSGLLIRYLMDHFDDLVSEDVTRGAITLRLFKLLFLSVSVYPDDNEAVLQPHLTDIIMNCLKRHQHTSRSLNYFLLLRSLFRSIGGGRFDALYKEVLPLLSVILEELGKLPLTTNDLVLRELYVELCLTTPVRLSVLLPYLSHLMKPLVLALQSSTELVSQGLRTLELCIDNLTQDFLEPIVYPVLDELLECLWGLLRPPPANQAHSHAAMRILGKMGGRSHRYLPLPRALPYNANPEDAQALVLSLSFDKYGTLRADLPLDRLVLSAATVLSPVAHSSPEQKLLAYDLITGCLRVLISSPKDKGDGENGHVVVPFQSQLSKDPHVSANCSQDVTYRLQKLQISTNEKTDGLRISKDFCNQTIRALFWASTYPVLAEQASLFLVDMYTVIAAALVQPNKYLASVLPPAEIFMDALIDITCSRSEYNSGNRDDDDLPPVVTAILERIHAVNANCSADDSAVLSVLMEKLITACYRVSSVEKIRVIRLISALRHLPLDITWVWVYEVRMVRGLLYAMKSFSPGLVSLYGTQATDTLLSFLRLCNRRQENMAHTSAAVTDEEGLQMKARRQQFFSQLVALLVSEISNANGLVRSAVQRCFQLLADLTGADVTELLLPLKDRLLAPIFTKPLRALPANLQIGYIDAITYCLSLRPPLLEVNDELLRLLNEAIALSEADDSFLASKTNQIQNSACILQLRLVCIRLLSMALSTTEFSQPRLQQVRNMIVAVFFKALYSRSPEVVEASRAALEQVMVNQHKLPKDLLQTALRPVLTNLAEAKRLTLPGLEGLRRVLELLTSYFKAEIGKKLLDHLAAWSEPKKPLQDAASRPLCESMECRVITAILDIFHLLPPSGHVFVAELVTVVIGLEKVVLRSASSPFRPPLQRLLSHYPEESVEHLLANVSDPAIVQIFAHIITLPRSDPLVHSMLLRVDRLMNELKMSTSSGIRLGLLKIIAQVLESDKLEPGTAIRIIEDLSSDILSKPSMQLEAIRETRVVYNMVCNHLSSNPSELQLAFAAISLHEHASIACPVSPPNLLQKTVSACFAQKGPSTAKFLIEAWCDFFSSREHSLATKVQSIRSLLLPCLSLVKSTGFSDELALKLVDTLSHVQPKATGHDVSLLAVEELQALSSLLNMCKDNDNLLSRIFGIILTKAHQTDPSVKFAAYCGLIDRLSAMDDAESLLQLLPSVLKMPTSETKPVVKQALDSLLKSVQSKPELYERVVDMISSAVLRESYSTVLISLIWQSVTSQIDCKELAVAMFPVLCSTFLRSAQAVYIGADSRSLPFELLGLFSRLPAKDLMTQSMFESIAGLTVKLLLSLAVTSANGASAGSHSSLNSAEELMENALGLFGQFVSVYSSPNRPLPWAGFDRVLVGDGEEQAGNQKAALSLAKALLAQRPSSRQRAIDLAALGTQLVVLMKQSSMQVVNELLPIIEMIFSLRPENPVLEVVISSLQSSAAEAILTSRNLPVAIHILSLSALMRSDDKILGSLVKILPRLCRDLLGKHEGISNGTVMPLELEFEANNILIPSIRIIMESGGETSRSTLLLVLGLLWERSVEVHILKYLIDLFISWTCATDEILTCPFSTKDISTILLTSNRLDQVKDDALLDHYLDLILNIYQSPTLRGSELTNRLEGSFLQGLASPKKRGQFLALLDSSISRDFALRLQYLLGGIRWHLAGSFDWIPIAVHLLILCIHDVHLSRPMHPMQEDVQEEIVRSAINHLGISLDPANILAYLEHFLYHNQDLGRHLWQSLFPCIWSRLGRADQEKVSLAIGKLLSTQESVFSMNSSNPIYCILAAASACENPPNIPAHLLRFTAQHQKTWYSSLALLEPKIEMVSEDSSKVAAMLYRDLGETDMMYGVMRRTCTLPESSAALSYAQSNRWGLAQKIAEFAQEATRAGSLPYLEGELSGWEDIWMDSAKKLQQWDLVAEVAKIDGDADLNMECIWRLGDWLQPETFTIAEDLLKNCTEVENPRTKFLESFLLLNQIREGSNERAAPRFQTSLEDAIQRALQAWNLLPEHVSRTHVNMLHTFQLFVEIQEAMTVYGGISGGASNPASMINRAQFLTDLKGLLSTWRERLPNRMDDMNIWSDLLAWRQHVFASLNSAFQPPAATTSGADGGIAAPQAHPFAFRGYHELAWLINKFSRVCRKNGLPETCLSFLNRIYTLPNIEIQDAFSKLREQTMCYLDTPADLPTALEVINATNLNYFSPNQKAEFFSMKALILSKLGMVEEANRVFAQAVQIDLNIGKGWAYWGNFNDQRFQQTHDITLAVSAINCYLQAATLFKISKSRKFGARILWLLTFEDAIGSMAKSFEQYNNDLPAWFWVAFIPQLLSSLARKEARLVRFLLFKIAKSFPQALYLPLRTAADEFRALYGNHKISGTSSATATRAPSVDDLQTLEGKRDVEDADSEQSATPSEPRKSPVDHSDDLQAMLKTGYPLLALSMENMVEHIVQRLRSTADEDLYRVIVTLLSEAFQQMMIRFNSASDGSSGNGMESSLKRVSFMLGSSPYLASTYKKAFDEDFGAPALDLDDIIALLQSWRTDLEKIIQKCPSSFSLESLSRFLAEFEFQRYDDVEVPGQYLQPKDNNADFVKIDRFEPIIEIVRRHGSSFRRIAIRGSNGSLFRFVVQNPSARQSRREEKIMQFFRTIRRGLKQNPNSRRRGLDFTIPTIVAISAHVRLIQDDPKQVTMEEIYEDFCKSKGLGSEDVLIHYRDCFQKEVDRLGIQLKKGNVEVLNLRVDLFQQIAQGLIPDNILQTYLKTLSPSPDQYWLFRQTFARQYAGSVFLAYVMALGHRYPHKISLSRSKATVLNTEILPTLNPNGQITLVEAVPFRLTPNIQEYMTPVVVEGVFTPAIHSYAEVFYRPDSELCEFLPMIVRDELISWVFMNQPSKPRFTTDSDGTPISFRHDLEILEQLNIDERQFLGRVIQNCELSMKRCQTLACIRETEKAGDGKTPAYQTILDLISCASNPQKLALMDAHWHPWF